MPSLAIGSLSRTNAEEANVRVRKGLEAFGQLPRIVYRAAPSPTTTNGAQYAG